MPDDRCAECGAAPPEGELLTSGFCDACLEAGIVDELMGELGDG